MRLLVAILVLVLACRAHEEDRTVCLTTNRTDITLSSLGLFEYVRVYNYTVSPMGATEGVVLVSISVVAGYPELNPPAYEPQSYASIRLPATRSDTPTHLQCEPPANTACYRYDRLLIKALDPADASLRTTVCYTVSTLRYATAIRLWYYIMVSALVVALVVLGTTALIVTAARYVNPGRYARV